MDIQKVREFIVSCPHLADFAPVYVDWTDENPTNYGIVDNGETTVATNIVGRRTKRHSYVLFSRAFSPEDGARIQNAQFNQNFQNWIEEQSDEENYPEAKNGEEIEEMVASNGMVIGYDPSSKTNIYQVQFYITYQEAKK